MGMNANALMIFFLSNVRLNRHCFDNECRQEKGHPRITQSTGVHKVIKNYLGDMVQNYGEAQGL